MRIEWVEVDWKKFNDFLEKHGKLLRSILFIIALFVLQDFVVWLLDLSYVQLYRNNANSKAIVDSNIKTATARRKTQELLDKALKDAEEKQNTISEKNIVFEIIDFNKMNYDKFGRDIAPKARDPKNISRILKACKDYEYIVKDQDPQGMIMYKFMLCVVQEACCFDPNNHYQNYLKDKKGRWILDKKGNKIPTTVDWGCGDINEDNHKWIEADPAMPEALKKRDWLNIEKSICARYIHLRGEMHDKRSWMKLKGNCGWTLYARIKNL